MSRWGSEGPPLDAYSRVTNPERFRPLHHFAVTLLTELHSSFNVERVEAYGLDSELEAGPLARPSVRLVPTNPNAAPLAIAFTDFPGLKIRVGRWYTAFFPACGCDACDESADDETTRLAQMIEDVVAGRFFEEVTLPLTGEVCLEWVLWSSSRHSAGRTQIDRERARTMLAEHESPLVWAPWQRRQTSGAAAG